MNNSAASWQKFLRIAAIVYMVVDVVFVVVGALVGVGVIDAATLTDALDIGEDVFVGQNAALAVAIMGWGMVVGYLVNLLANLLVYRGAKDPAKMKPGIVFYAIFSAVCLVTIVSALVGGTFSLGMLCQGLIAWVIFYGTVKVGRSAKAK